MLTQKGAIGVFDSGYGGLTILAELRKELPQNDFIYLGDNFRAPYGSKHSDIIYEYTLQGVKELFRRGCNLIILACNTASANALRTIQQIDLPKIDKDKRVLGIIRPTAEIVGDLSLTKHIGVLGTEMTIKSEIYNKEVKEKFPETTIVGHACPLWAPFVENGQAESGEINCFIKKDIDIILKKDPQIDALILACTHYPLLINKIRQFTPEHIKIITQGRKVAKSLADYLKRHPEINEFCSKNSKIEYLTTGDASLFDIMANIFMNEYVLSEKIELK